MKMKKSANDIIGTPLKSKYRRDMVINVPEPELKIIDVPSDKISSSSSSLPPKKEVRTNIQQLGDKLAQRFKSNSPIERNKGKELEGKKKFMKAMTEQEKDLKITEEE